MIVILVPVLRRPQNAERVFASVTENTSSPHQVLFICSPADLDEHYACVSTGASVEVVEWSAGGGDWARKINHGIKFAISIWKKNVEWFLLGADDLRFHPNWDTNALLVAKQSGAGVIGTNDLGNATVMRGDHSTHPLVSRAYVENFGSIDDPSRLLHEGYQHQWVDTELVATAQARGQWSFAKNSYVEHLHPLWRKSEMDETYRKALSTPHEDRNLFRSRKALWEKSRATV